MPLNITLENIFYRKSGNSGPEILKNVSLSVNNDIITLISGPPGSGKSTLMELISLNLKPSSGKITINGEAAGDFSAKRLRHIRRLISVIPPVPCFIEGKSIYENLEYVLRLEGIPRSMVFDRVMDLLAPAGLILKRELLPSELSSQEKSLLAFSMALIREPELILCDLNITSSVDEYRLREFIKTAPARSTGVVVSCRSDASESFSDTDCKVITLSENV